MPRKSVPGRGRRFGLRGRVMAGNSGSFRTPQSQVSGSSELPSGFLRPSGFGSGRSATSLPIVPRMSQEDDRPRRYVAHLIVILAPALELVTHVGEREEHLHVQALIAQSSVK